MHEGAQKVSDQQRHWAMQGSENEQREQFIGMKREHYPTRLIRKVVKQEARRNRTAHLPCLASSSVRERLLCVRDVCKCPRGATPVGYLGVGGASLVM